MQTQQKCHTAGILSRPQSEPITVLGMSFINKDLHNENKPA